MDRHPQQIKRERQDKKKRLINISKNSDMRTVVKNVLNNKNKDEAALLHKKAMSAIDNHWYEIILLPIRVTIIAKSIPKADIKLPFCAVSGELSIFNPKINKIEANM